MRRFMAHPHAWLGGLAIVALLPRVALALQRDIICSDAVFFLERSEALANGNVTASLNELGLNLYTLWLAAAQLVGFDALPVGIWTSVVASTLTVIPLAWLTAEWFGRRSAVVVALLYSFHPEALDWSAEVIRDPLFWLAWMTGLAMACGASRGGSWRAWLAWGVSFSAAVLLRSEGFLLFIPAILWGCTTPSRYALWLNARGFAVALAVWLLSLLVINAVFMAAGHSQWELGRLDHVRMIWQYPARVFAGESKTAISTSRPLQAAAQHGPRPLGARELIWGLKHNLQRGVGMPALLLITVGAGLALSTQPRIVPLALGLIAAGIVIAMGLHLAEYRELTRRYTVPLLLAGLPLAGLAACEAVRATELALRETPRLRRWSQSAFLALLATVCGAGVTDGLTRANESRSYKAALGRFLLAHLGEHQRILASPNLERLVGYYAHAEHVKLPPEIGGMQAVEWLRWKRPTCAVFWKPGNAQRYGELLTAPSCLGYMQVPLPPEFRDTVLLVHRDRLESLANHRAKPCVACQSPCHFYTSVAVATRGRPSTARR